MATCLHLYIVASLLMALNTIQLFRSYRPILGSPWKLTHTGNHKLVEHSVDCSLHSVPDIQVISITSVHQRRPRNSDCEREKKNGAV